MVGNICLSISTDRQAYAKYALNGGLPDGPASVTDKHTMPKLTPALITRIENGDVVMIAEWRQCNVDTVKLKDKVSGAVRVSTVCRHGLETSKEQVSCSEWLPDGTDAKSVKIPFAKGQAVVIVVTSVNREKGLLTVGGHIEAL